MLPKSTKVLDVRGKSCPIPVLQTRNKLRDMRSGEILDVYGDFPQAKNNIIRIVESEGHEILHIIDQKTSYHILIRKK